MEDREEITGRDGVVVSLKQALSELETPGGHEPLVAVQGLDEKGVISQWNAGCEHLYGYSEPEALGSRVQDLLLSGAEVARFEKALAEVVRTAEASQPRERMVKTSGGSRWVLSVMFPVLENGQVEKVYSVDVDMTERKLAEEELAYRVKLLDSATDSILVYDFEGDFIYANRAACGSLGYGREELEAMRLYELVPAEQREELRLAVEVLNGSREATLRTSQVRKDGTVEPVEIHASVVDWSRGKAILCLVRRVAPYAESEEGVARLNRLYSVLIKTNEAIVRIKEPQELYEEACRISVEEGLCSLAWVGIVDSDTNIVKPVARWGKDAGYLDEVCVSILEIPEGFDSTGTAVRENRYVVCEDFGRDAKALPWKEKARKRGFRSNAAFPLRVGKDVVGAFTLYSEEPRFFDENQVRLLESLSSDLSFAIESLVKERQREKAEDALSAGESYFRSLIENALDIMAVIDAEGVVRYASPSIERVLGYKRSEVRGRHSLGFIHEEDAGTFTGLLEAIRRDPSAAQFAEVRFHHKDGGFRMLETIGGSFVDSDGVPGIVINARDVTERKLAEAHLRQSEDTVRALLSAPPESAFMVDTRGTIIALNDAGAKALKGSTDDLVGASLFELLPPEVTKERRAKIEQVLRTGRPVRFEDECEGAYFDNSVYPVFDEPGKVSRLAIYARDMTAQKRVDAIQKKDRDFISAVLDTVAALVVVLEKEGRIVLFNRSCEETTGYSAEEVRGRPVWDLLVSPEDVAMAKAVFKDMMVGQPASEYKNYWLTKSGDRRLIQWSNTALLGEGGSVEYVIGTGIDVTERKVAEDALRESEEKYRTIFESTGTAMCILERDTTISFLNHEFERMTGYSADDVEWHKSFKDFLLDEDIGDVLKYHEDAVDDRLEAPVIFESRIRDRKGKSIDVLVNLGRLSWMDSSVVSLIDITKEKGYERNLRENAERMRRFLAVASHELRHPITIVGGYAKTLITHMDKMSKKEISEILKDMDVAADRLTGFVEELIDYTRVEDGHLSVDKKELDLELLLKMSLKNMQEMSLENELKLEVAREIGLVEVDPEKFIQLLVILLENAIKFSPPGAPVEVIAEREDGEVVISVLDNGMGVPEEHRERIFDRFYQVEDAQHHSKPGMGLGLYIAREIVKAHGGMIRYEPREGGGSAFRLNIE